MSDARRCPECNASIPVDAPAGICPTCLYKNALPDAAAEACTRSDGPGRFKPLASEQLARAFPQLTELELLGQGGMGTVYRARQPSLDRLVAVKILPPELAADVGFVDRFLREAKTLARLGNHPHIVAVHDMGQSAGLLYVIMEYVDGVNLREAIRENRLAPPEALSIIGQICEALQFAHDQGVVHRDIKPENILLDRHGRVKIADFGLAKLMAVDGREESLTGTHQVLGTLRYMAPEQLEGSRDVDHRADIFSLGVVFYEILTGEVPLGHFQPPSKKADVDARLDNVVLRALHRVPEDRYQRASELKSDVEHISATERPPPPAKPVAALPAAQRSSSLPLVVVIVLILVGVPGALLLVGGLALAVHWATPVSREPQGNGPDIQPEALAVRTLSIAAQGDHDEVKRLLEQGEDPNQKDEAGCTPLLRAAIAGEGRIAQTLIDAGAELEDRTPTGTSALMEAAFGGHLAVVRVLLDANASIKVTDNDGRTALDHAVCTDQRVVAALLLERGAQETGPYLTWNAHRLLKEGKSPEAYEVLQQAVAGDTIQPSRWQYQVADWRYRVHRPEMYMHALLLECAQRMGEEEKAKSHLGRLNEFRSSLKDTIYTASWLSPAALAGKRLDEENYLEETYWITAPSLDAISGDWNTPLELHYTQRKRETRGNVHSDTTTHGKVQRIARY